jgi:uroporphyrinogen decarboxylase
MVPFHRQRTGAEAQMTPVERFQRACRGDVVDRPPVWIMRQAGRTLPEYRALREKHSFWEMCRTPELAAEVTLQPIRRFGMDAAVIFSDILTVPAAMGLTVEFTPRLTVTPEIRQAADVDRLETADPDEKLDYVAGVIREVRRQAGPDLAILGFSGAPFTLACYMVEGGGSKHFQQIKRFMHGQTPAFDALMARLSEAVADYLLMQVRAGATAVQLFDTWAVELSPTDFRTYVLPYVRDIVRRVQATGTPVIYYINGIAGLLEAAGEAGADVLGIDWRLELADVRQRLGADTIVQGNLDPGVLMAPPSIIRDRVFSILTQTGGRGHILNLGHGLPPETPLEGIAAFMDAALTWNKETANE